MKTLHLCDGTRDKFHKDVSRGHHINSESMTNFMTVIFFDGVERQTYKDTSRHKHKDKLHEIDQQISQGSSTSLTLSRGKIHKPRAKKVL